MTFKFYYYFFLFRFRSPIWFLFQICLGILLIFHISSFISLNISSILTLKYAVNSCVQRYCRSDSAVLSLLACNVLVYLWVLWLFLMVSLGFSDLFHGNSLGIFICCSEYLVYHTARETCSKPWYPYQQYYRSPNVGGY